MPIPILVNGAQGKMGKEIVTTFRQDKDFTIVATTDRTDDLGAAIEQSQARVVIDFTTASAGFQNASMIIQAGAHPVIGTTGFLADQIEELQKRCARQQLGGVIAPNFSIGAVLMMQFAAQASRYFSQAEIIEMHHNTKEEAPSGTALHTANLMARARQEAPPLKKYKEIIPHARGAAHQDIPLHSIRLPGLVAHQMVIFGGRGETFTLRHDSAHRECFMPGIKLACKKAVELKSLVYGLENLL